MLSVYVRELSREHPAKDAPTSNDLDILQDWARALTPARSDMQNAAQALGRLKKTTGLPLDSGEIDLTAANMQGFDLVGLNFSGTKMKGVQLQGANLSGAQLQGANLWGAQLQGADLSGAQLQGAYLRGAHFDRSTSFEAATFQGASLREVDFTDTTIEQDQILEMFGDGTVILPGGHGPDHESWPVDWSKEKLSGPDFNTKWRAFQRSIGQDPDNPT